MSEVTDVATAIGAIVAAGAAVYTAWLAREASDTWRKGLEYQRIDEAISAVRELRSKINRVIALMNTGNQDVWPTFDDAWDGWNRFDQAYAVARRYHTSLSNAAGEQFADLLNELKTYCRSYAPRHGGIPPDHQASLRSLKDNVQRIAESTEKALRSLTEATP